VSCDPLAAQRPSLGPRQRVYKAAPARSGQELRPVHPHNARRISRGSSGRTHQYIRMNAERAAAPASLSLTVQYTCDELINLRPSCCRIRKALAPDRASSVPVQDPSGTPASRTRRKGFTRGDNPKGREEDEFKETMHPKRCTRMILH
jgi:hypothetical protein